MKLEMKELDEFLKICKTAKGTRFIGVDVQPLADREGNAAGARVIATLVLTDGANEDQSVLLDAPQDLGKADERYHIILNALNSIKDVVVFRGTAIARA